MASIVAGNKMARAPHTPLVYRIFEPFFAAGCPKPTWSPRKKGDRGVKPFGHGKSSNPEKVHKYSVNTPRLRDP
jgi:hypothetical protein